MSRSPDRPPARAWPTWVLFGVFCFLAFECLLLAVVMKGEWWILLVPSIVCSIKARETWVRLREIVGPRDSGRDPTTSA